MKHSYEMCDGCYYLQEYEWQKEEIKALKARLEKETARKNEWYELFCQLRDICDANEVERQIEEL